MQVTFQSKNQIAYNALHEAILQGQYAPGSRLIIDELVIKLRVSAIPIREALRQLEGEGFVTFEPHVGFTVTPIHEGLVHEVFTLLETTELYCSRLACERMISDSLAELESLMRGMDALTTNPAEWSKRNKALHLFISDQAETTLIRAVMQRALDHWDRLQNHYFRDVLANRITTAQAEHWRILAAFKQRDVAAVEREIRQHNRLALDAYLANL